MTRHPNQRNPIITPSARSRRGGGYFAPWHPADIAWVDAFYADRVTQGKATAEDREAIRNLAAPEDGQRIAREDREDAAATLYAIIARCESLTERERDALHLAARGLGFADAGRSHGVSRQAMFETVQRAVAKITGAPPPPRREREAVARRRQQAARARRAARWAILARARRRSRAPQREAPCLGC